MSNGIGIRQKEVVRLSQLEVITQSKRRGTCQEISLIGDIVNYRETILPNHQLIFLFSKC